MIRFDIASQDIKIDGINVATAISVQDHNLKNIKINKKGINELIDLRDTYPNVQNLKHSIKFSVNFKGLTESKKTTTNATYLLNIRFMADIEFCLERPCTDSTSSKKVNGFGSIDVAIKNMRFAESDPVCIDYLLSENNSPINKSNFFLRKNIPTELLTTPFLSASCYFMQQANSMALISQISNYLGKGDKKNNTAWLNKVWEIVVAATPMIVYLRDKGVFNLDAETYLKNISLSKLESFAYRSNIDYEDYHFDPEFSKKALAIRNYLNELTNYISNPFDWEVNKVHGLAIAQIRGAFNSWSNDLVLSGDTNIKQGIIESIQASGLIHQAIKEELLNSIDWTSCKYIF